MSSSHAARSDRSARSDRTAGAGSSLLPALAALALALLLGACSAGTTPSPSPVATSSVDLPKSYRFVPEAIAVPVGTTVTWANHDDFTHNVAFEDAEPLTMVPGATTSHTFTTPGAFPYRCSLHPNDMQGSVLVTGS
jgi:plastocyanin